MLRKMENVNKFLIVKFVNYAHLSLNNLNNTEGKSVYTYIIAHPNQLTEIPLNERFC